MGSIPPNHGDYRHYDSLHMIGSRYRSWVCPIHLPHHRRSDHRQNLEDDHDDQDGQIIMVMVRMMVTTTMVTWV